ncbi:MAG: hypothetical protein WCK46_02585 [Candidatus Adlerbacteria bacterium]
MKKISLFGSLTFLLVPFIASASNLDNIINIINALGTIVNRLIPLLVGVAIIVFFWGLIKYIQASGKDASAGKNIMIAGLISLFVMVSLYGIIRFAGSAIGISINGEGNAGRPTAPAIPPQI